MIALASDCLLFQLASGESVPLSAEMISIELMGGTAEWFDSEFVRHAANAVFHYFKQDLDRQTVTVGEFAGALEKVLRGFTPAGAGARAPRSQEWRSRTWAGWRANRERALELFFFPRLREELRHKMRQAPQVVRFRGLRSCVMQLAGARRWTRRCQTIEEQIVSFLRGCLTAEAGQTQLSLVVQ